jgi:4-hydroxybenzoate polyprenyltransferase
MSQLRELLVAVRPRQWVKNAFLLAGLVFSRHLLDAPVLLRVLAGVLTFCAASSAVYLFNDLYDIEQDREHPEKRNRPLAAGRLDPRVAWISLVVLAAGALVSAWALDRGFIWIVGTYLALNAAYSPFLKHFVVIDVMVIASGFVLRVLGGTALAGVEPSDWLILCTIMLSLFLGFSKRRHEVATIGDRATSHRRVLAHYSLPFLDQINAATCAGTIMCYALYTLSAETVQRFGTRRLVLTVPFVVYGVFRYLYLTHQRSLGGNPTRAVLEDGPIVIAGILWAAVVFVILYLKP